MDALLLTDFARFSHILTVTIGLGGAYLADFYVFSRLNVPIESKFIETLKQYHVHVATAIFAMWVTGLLMVFIRTGFDVEKFSPKLFSKLGIVALLTVNAVLIGRIAMPILARNVGVRPLDLPFSQKIGVALMSGVSTVSWLLALAMGISKVLAASPWATFQVVVPLAYAAAILASVSAILLIDGSRMVIRMVRARTTMQSSVCNCAACRREGDVLEQLLSLRDDLLALQSGRDVVLPALNFAPVRRTAGA